MSVSSLLVFQVSVMRWAGLSAALAATFAGGRGLLQLLGRLPLVPIVDRFGVWKVQIACRSAIGLGAIALAFSGSIPFAVGYIVIIGASAGALSAIDGMVAREILPTKDFATLASVLGLIGTVGSALGPIVVGLLVQASNTLGVVPVVVVATGISAPVIQILGARSRSRN
jgi:MFS family permease